MEWIWPRSSSCSPIEGHVGCFQCLAIIEKLPWTWMCMFLCWQKFISLDRCPGVQLLGYKLSTCLFLFFFNVKLFFRMAVPFYISIHNVWESHFLCIFSSIWYCHWFFISAVLISMSCCPIMGLICIFLMTRDIEHIFVCLLAMCVSSLVKCPFINIYI